MGLHEKGEGGGNTVFLSPINTSNGAKWAQRVSKDTENAVSRDAKCGVVFEKYYSSVDGVIQSVRIPTSTEYDEEVEVCLLDKDIVYMLQIPLKGSLGSGFICRIEELERGAWVEIGMFTSGERRSLWIKQNEEKVINKYAKRKDESGALVDGEKKLPDPIIRKKPNGEEDRNYGEREDFLYGMCADFSIENEWASDTDDFKCSGFKKSNPSVEATPDRKETNDEYEDDIPF